MFTFETLFSVSNIASMTDVLLDICLQDVDSKMDFFPAC